MSTVCFSCFLFFFGFGILSKYENEIFEEKIFYTLELFGFEIISWRKRNNVFLRKTSKIDEIMDIEKSIRYSTHTKSHILSTWVQLTQIFRLLLYLSNHPHFPLYFHIPSVFFLLLKYEFDNSLSMWWYVIMLMTLLKHERNGKKKTKKNRNSWTLFLQSSLFCRPKRLNIIIPNINMDERTTHQRIYWNRWHYLFLSHSIHLKKHNIGKIVKPHQHQHPIQSNPIPTAHNSSEHRKHL